eukprot:1196018-Prorocentrum_minimum.AAC.3
MGYGDGVRTGNGVRYTVGVASGRSSWRATQLVGLRNIPLMRGCDWLGSGSLPEGPPGGRREVAPKERRGQSPASGEVGASARERRCRRCQKPAG